MSLEKLYNNYRVCSKHFAHYMFLNDLKNRLQPHAVPRAVINIAYEESIPTQSETNSNFSIIKYTVTFYNCVLKLFDVLLLLHTKVKKIF